MQYLMEVGGERPNEEKLYVAREGWAAWLEELPPARITMMSIRRDMLIIKGEDDATAPIYHHMRQRTVCGGG